MVMESSFLQAINHLRTQFPGLKGLLVVKFAETGWRLGIFSGTAKPKAIRVANGTPANRSFNVLLKNNKLDTIVELGDSWYKLSTIDHTSSEPRMWFEFVTTKEDAKNATVALLQKPAQIEVIEPDK